MTTMMKNAERPSYFFRNVTVGWHYASNPEPFAEGVKAIATAVNGVAKQSNVASTPQLPLKPAIGKTKASTIAVKQISPSVLKYPLAEIKVSTIAQTNKAHQPLKGKGDRSVLSLLNYSPSDDYQYRLFPLQAASQSPF